MKDALDDLTSSRFVIGDHHFKLHLLDVPFEGSGDGAARLKHLHDHVAQARHLLGDTGMVVAREDLALEAAFWAQLPGNFRFRSRKAPITNRNIAAMVPFHNFPTGRAHGNHWGDALTMLVTSACSAFQPRNALHASDPRAPDGGSRRDVGHVCGIGPVGTGRRLRRRCATSGGDDAWVFDNPVARSSRCSIVGFDVTDFLEHPRVRDPLSMYLFHLARRMAGGRRLAVWADEFARVLADRSFATFAWNGLEGWRKKNAALAAFTQSASHVLGSDIARAIVEQTPVARSNFVAAKAVYQRRGLTAAQWVGIPSCQRGNHDQTHR